MVVVATACACAGSSGEAQVVRVEIRGAVAQVSPRFLSVAVDSSQVVGGHFWGPSGEIEGGFGGQRVEPYDFTRPRLQRLARELSPAYLRIGGSEADSVYYDLGEAPVKEPPAPFSAVLTRAQWDGVNAFAARMGFEVLFTLNAGPGTRDRAKRWTADDARRLLQYTAQARYPVTVWELGNEINGFIAIHGPAHRVTGAQYAADVAVARALVNELTPQIRLAGPSSAYWPVVGEMSPIFGDFMRQGGHLLDIVTWHYYPQQSRRCPLRFRLAGPAVLLEPQALAEVDRWADEVESARARSAPGAEVWLGETGNAQCGGEPGVSDAFVGSLWWIDQLGRMARRGQQVVIRQTLSGSNYGLLDDVTLRPNPDYWSSVLWKRLMDTRVLEVVTTGSPRVRSYAHCTPRGAFGAGDRAVTVVVLNLDPARPAELSFADLGSEAWLFTATADSAQSRSVRLNGVQLEADAAGGLPPLTYERRQIAAGTPLVVPPLSYSFAVFPSAFAAACG